VVAPVDNAFSIIVPKIGANAKVIEDVDPYNSAEYQLALTKGVAHARGTSFPGQGGNTFLFAHSSDNFYNANRYNSVFYLLHKLELGDAFYIIKDGVVYKYEVSATSVVSADAIEFLEDLGGETEHATLMTCWPPGTTLKRLVVVGNLVSD
jgi:LPXTG-site transpeptidase (sortase) family protein